MSIRPEIQRIRHELKRRDLMVGAVERLTPHMIRVTLRGEELEDFVSDGADDHCKIAFPVSRGEPQKRDFTPRRFSRERCELVIDFVDHVGGPATKWARNAQIGDRLVVGGPRGSQVIGGDVRRWVLIGDETALPAIGRRIEELPAGTPVTSIVTVPGPKDEQTFETAANLDAHWLHRPQEAGDDAAPLLAALQDLDLPPQTFVWIAAEASVAKALRNHLLVEREFPAVWMKASGYWIKGQADAAIKSFDED